MHPDILELIKKIDLLSDRAESISDDLLDLRSVAYALFDLEDGVNGPEKIS